MSTQQNAYPLSWPPAWKRCEFRRRSNFGDRSVDKATRAILHELKLLGVGNWNVIISTNVPLRKDGYPQSNTIQPRDPGVAVYFKLKERPCVLACDKWDRVECNMWAIAKDIEAQRGRIRWGVGSVEQAFAGYTALPAPGDSGAATWYSVLGVDASCSYEAATAAYRDEAMRRHPDRPGGSHEAMTQLNSAWDQARKHFGK